MKLLREPLAHFLVIGAAIFVLYGLMGQQDAEEQECASPSHHPSHGGCVDQFTSGGT